MTPLIRPAGSSESAGLQLEPKLEVALEQQILLKISELSTEVGGLRGQVRDLRSILMGAGDVGETAYGRLPMVESKVAAHEVEIANLKSRVERLVMYKENASTAGRWMSGIVGVIIGGVAVGLILALISWATRLPVSH